MLKNSFQRFVTLFKLHKRAYTLIVVLLMTFAGIVISRANDGELWLDGGKMFYDSLARGDFASTHYSSRFGVSVMWLYGIAHVAWSVTGFPLEKILSTIVYVITVVGIFVFVSRIKNFANKEFPWFVILIYLLITPYVISSPLYTTWLDKILTVSTALCILFWTEYLMCGQKKWVILWTGMCMGIAFLTKPAGIILLPLVMTMTGYTLWGNRSRNVIKPTLYVFFIAAAIFVIFYPAMWIDPRGVLMSRLTSSDAQIELAVPLLTNNSFILHIENVTEVFIADFMLTFGVVMVVRDLILAVRNKMLTQFLTPVTFLSAVGVLYVVLSFVIAIFLVDKVYGNIVSPRYIAPAIPLVAIYPLIKFRNNSLITSLALIVQCYRLPVVIWTFWILSYLIFGRVIYVPYW